MDKPEPDKASAGPDESSLARNRSFKSKQLVRSQAIRESHSPPRTISPYPTSPVTEPKASNSPPAEKRENGDKAPALDDKRQPEEKKKPEIQITSSPWEGGQRQRARRWLGNRSASAVGCGCVARACECPHCRGQRRKHDCPIRKQDSGIACSVDCPDCNFDHSTKRDNIRKTGSFEDPSLYGRGFERRDRQRNFSFTRSDSDIAEPSWPELVSFIKATLNKNARDRETLLRVEREMTAFVNDPKRLIVKFPTMTTYGRMLVHRCAALFQLSHRMDMQQRNTVLVSKNGTNGGRIPCTRFIKWCVATFPKSPARNEEEVSAKSILKRSAGSEEGGGGGAAAPRSLEQRERDYERVRRRIFCTDNNNQDTEWPWLPTGPIKLLTPEPGRNKLIKVQSLESRGAPDNGPRNPVSKSHSLDGYSAEQTVNTQTRLLSRQGDLASSSWRLSPSSSGYKTLSLRSTDSVTPSPTGCPSPDSTARSTTPTAPVDADSAPSAAPDAPARSALAPVMWAVTDMSAVPPGALLIHPQTGRPLTHPDGTLYHYDPANPPIIQDDNVYFQNGVQEANAEKKRGRLEKQHSFIDNGCECPNETCDDKCCCDCPEQDVCTKCPIDQLTLSAHSSKQNSAPTSPVKRPDTVTTTEPNNQRPAYDATTNQRPPYDTPANHKVTYDNPTNQGTDAVNYSPSRRPNYNTLQRYDNQRYDQRCARYDQRVDNPPEVSANNNLRSVEIPNQRVPVEVPANQRPVMDAPANQRAFEPQRFEMQRPASYEQSVQRNDGHKVEGVQYAQSYMQYRNDEITSPQQVPSHYQAPDIAEMQAMIAQKMTPVPMPDPNIRPMSVAANVMYPAAMHQGYQYVNPCRLEQPLQPIYQPLVQQVLPAAPQMLALDEQKHVVASPHTDNTFRIDPSYPYATDYNTACGACTDPNTLQHQQRSVSVGYGQMEMPQTVVPQAYPMHNVMPQIPPYPYQDAVQWAGAVNVGGAAHHKVLMPEVCPVICPAIYPPYNMLYPQVLPQPYQLCPPVYPAVDKQTDMYQQRAYNPRSSKRSSASGSARATPLRAEGQSTPDDRRDNRDNRDIASRNNREVRDVTNNPPVANRDVGNREVPSRDPPSRETLNQSNRIDSTRVDSRIDTSNPSIDNANLSTDNVHRSVDNVNRSTEIADTIAQIKEQLALNKDKDRGYRGREEWRRRNSGGGILGSYPVNNFNGRVMGRPANEEAQINPAIYNSIRNMQAKQNYQHQQDRRLYEFVPNRFDNRFDNRYDNRRRYDRDGRVWQGGQVGQGGQGGQGGDARLRGDRGGFRPDTLTRRAVNVPFQLRPPYLLRQMAPGTWNRRSPGIIPPVMNLPRRPHPDRNPRR